MTLDIRRGPDNTVRVYTGPGIYREHVPGIEALIKEAKLFVGYDQGRRNSLFTEEMEDQLGVNNQVVSRARRGLINIPLVWLLKIHLWSGLPISACETLSGIEIGVQPYYDL